MRVGVVLLPQARWALAREQWQRVEALGFDHAWTYDHLAWRSLADEAWFGTVPLLAAAAVATERVRLGTWVASPNFRHPVTFAKELMTLDDLSDGRFTLGVGAGGTGFDATVLGGAVLSPRERVDRLAEFVGLLDELLREPVTTVHGARYSAVDARMLPGCLQRPRLPFVVAANGPRAMRVAVAHGAGWATTGPEGVTGEQWWSAVAGLVGRLEDTEVDGRSGTGLERYLNLDSGGVYALSSVEAFRDQVGRADELGFTDVVVHHPRTEGVYAGRVEVLEAVAAEL
ncbi:LLM class flavin-dependent oxidoreductase [Rhodococcus antarcticus]|uniref:LLM class flavin-dependent oxidoreductase n=1 Tax=Rhodococcus antarcticus TaxID=2987751 RepID=A0ABY6NYT8_9NOCA|nr:LLM class flavin-dependent oxidoreductase [Rhodococcus antarcticus]UZJ24557.1 LLM class flavin-dependent oxidoreductase [Rhodococcus antarcticus]